MPLCGRIAGLDICLFGPPAAHHVQRYSSSPLSQSFFQNLYPNRTQSLTASPLNYRVNSYTKTIANGRSAYHRAKKALETGEAMELPWVKFWRCGTGNHWQPSDIVIIAAKVIPFLWISNVNTLVHAYHKRASFTLTWGTTARHVLRGEESIQVSKNSNGDVIFHLRSFSKPHTFLSWLTYPLVIHLQHRFARDVAKRVQQIANQQNRFSTDTTIPIERGKSKQENLHRGRLYKYQSDLKNI